MSEFLERITAAHLPEQERPVFSNHPSFAGVRLATLVAGQQSGGAMKTLLVRLEPGARMLPHCHEREAEQHLVLDGEGEAMVGDKRLVYHPGALSLIPRGEQHSVLAGERGMMILATFCASPS